LYETRDASAAKRLSATLRTAKRLQRAPDGCGDGAKPGDELSENFRRQRLVTVALGQFGRIVHFDHERVRTGSDCGETHLRDKFAQTERMCRIDNDWQMRFGFQDWNSAKIERVAGGRLERANPALAEDNVRVTLV